MSARG
jgi:hypothetical protein